MFGTVKILSLYLIVSNFANNVIYPAIAFCIKVCDIYFMKTANTSFIILCVIKPDHKEAQALAHSSIEFFNSYGIECLLLSSHAVKEEIAKQAALSKAVLVFGGDGTMLATARALHSIDIPLFGFNFGKVGFLMEGRPDNHIYWLTRFLASLKQVYQDEIENLDSLEKLSKADLQEKALYIEEDTILKCEVVQDNKVKYTSFAINDAVVSRMNIARAISLTISVDTILLSTLRCDGLIVSTPLGATGYALSAHGPLAMPDLEATIITPICPFASSLPPCVVSSHSIISICSPDASDQTILTLDGQENILLDHNDTVNIVAHTQKMKLFISDKTWYPKRLVERGFIRHTS